ncbi:MAG: putative baseplate assembly protein [Chloroflexota bacterium]
MVSAPKIDARSREILLRTLREYAVDYSAWQVQDTPDAGEALMTLFSYMLDDVAVRLNRMPDKNFIAFLNLLGVTATPPQAARVPLQFMLAEGSREGVQVPAWTQVGAVTDAGDVPFETSESVYVNPTHITEVFSRVPNADRYANLGAILSGTGEIAETVFAATDADEPIPHVFYIAQDALLGLPAGKRVSVIFETLDASKLDAFPLYWSYWDGEQWQALTVTEQLLTHYLYEVTIEPCPECMPTVVNGIEARWLRVALGVSLAPVHISGEDLLTLSEQVIDLDDFAPFHQRQRFPFLMHLKPADDEVEYLNFDIVLSEHGTPSARMVLAWQYWNGEDWVDVGWSGPAWDDEDAVAFPDFEDGTHALSQDGRVRFPMPDDWAQEHEGGWLRLVVVSGSFGRGSASTNPVIEKLVGHYEWQLRALPLVERVSIVAEEAQTGLLPSRAYYLTEPLDLSADAFPFGQEPAFNSTFYVECGEAFAKPNAEITLHVGITNPYNAETADPLPPVRPSANLLLAWDVWNGQTWETVGMSSPQQDTAGASTYDFSDGTFCFLQAGRIRFRLPWGVSEAELGNGDIGYWLRVRIIRGNYGLPQQYRSSGSSYTLTDATFAPPAINSLTIDYEYTPEAVPDMCMSYNDFVYYDLTQALREFDDPREIFHRSEDSDPALYIAVESTSPHPDDAMPFHNAPATLFFEVNTQFAREEFDAIVAHPQSDNPVLLVWEYWSVDGAWRRLVVEDGTAELTQRGTVSFVGPADFAPSWQFDRLCYWVRVRLERGDYSVAPRLRRLLINTTWGLQGERFANQILGSSTGEVRQAFAIDATGIILAGQEVQVRYDADDDDAYEWVTWQEVSDFYGSAYEDRHYTLNRVSGEIRFGDGRYGAIPPVGANNVRVTYRVGGSPEGNVPAVSITQLKTTIPRIDSVINPLSAQGGSAQESITRTKKRGPTVLRHSNRAVTAQDYVDLAYEIPAVKRAIALMPPDDASAGQVGLVIVPDVAAPQPVPSLGLIEQVRKMLLAVAPPTVDIWVTGPDWLEVSVEVDFVPLSLDLAVATRYAIERRLRDFLHPLTGYEGAGWAFGRRPQASDMYALLEDISGVDYVLDLVIHEASLAPPRDNRFLVHAGTQTVRIAAGEEIR